MNRFPRPLRSPVTAVLLPAAPASRASTGEAADLSGFVRDAGDGESLPFATVCLEGQDRGGISNESGYYAIAGVPPGRVHPRRLDHRLQDRNAGPRDRRPRPCRRGPHGVADAGSKERSEVRGGAGSETGPILHVDGGAGVFGSFAADGFRLYAEKGENGNMKVTAFKRSRPWREPPP